MKRWKCEHENEKLEMNRRILWFRAHHFAYQPGYRTPPYRGHHFAYQPVYMTPPFRGPHFAYHPGYRTLRDA